MTMVQFSQIRPHDGHLCRLSLEGIRFLDEALMLQGHAYDEETKAVLQREAFIFRVMQNISGVDFSESPSEHVPYLAFSSAYQLMTSGFALCAMQDNRGAEYIKQAMPIISEKRANTIYAVSRNLDAPLIAAAGRNAACEGYVDELTILLRG